MRKHPHPAGTIEERGPIASTTDGFHHNWIGGLLPMLDAKNVYDAIDHTASVYAPANAEVRSLRLPGLRCPSASGMNLNTTCYAAMHASTETPIDEDNDGAFRLNIPVADHDITDGLGHTIFVGEKLSRPDEDLGWISGTRSSLRNTGHAINAERKRARGFAGKGDDVQSNYVGGLASDHPGACTCCLAAVNINSEATRWTRDCFAR